jgi:outer membrane protein OmpA-like peptidoglycan-associated protein
VADPRSRICEPCARLRRNGSRDCSLVRPTGTDRGGTAERFETRSEEGGGTSTEPLPGSVEKQRFIDRTRTDRTRQLTLDTPNASRIADDRPSIALGITFQYNSAELSFATTQQLTQLGRALASPALKGGVFLIAGHTDAKGSDLSQRRADAVKRFLMENFGIPDENLVTVGYGKRQLKNTADPFAAENRRIEIVNLSGGGCRRGPSSAPFC